MVHVLNKIKSLVIWRKVTRSHRLKWVAALLFFILLLIIVIGSIEDTVFKSICDKFYFAVVTITTVGYGDFTPETNIGRVLTVFLILTGVVLVSFMTATIASILTTTRIREGMGLKKVDREGHIVICGFNFNIERVIKSIVASSKISVPEIVLINTRPESEITDLIEAFPEASIRFVNGDYTLESTLSRASVMKASSVIILADNGPEGSEKPDDRTLRTALAIKSIAPDTKLSVELLNDTSEVHLLRAGVDQIVLSGEFSGFLLAAAVMTPGIPQALKEIMQIDAGGNISRVPFPDDMVGISFRKAYLEFFDRFECILIGVIAKSKSFNLETVLSGEKDAIDDFIRRKFDEAGRSLEIESKGYVAVNINPGKDYIISKDDYAVVINSKHEETGL